MGGDRFYSHRRWRTIRLAVLERDGWVCKIRAPGCTVVAEHVDHIVPRRLNGAAYDPRNLRAACAKCNLGRPDPRLGLRRPVSSPSREW
jgi:5-methylcytosine-specific restriction endonuclease McrA